MHLLGWEVLEEGEMVRFCVKSSPLLNEWGFQRMKVEGFSQVDLASAFAVLSSFSDLIH